MAKSIMQLLLSLYLPLLPLQAQRQRWSESAAAVIIDAGRVIACSTVAVESGIREGMRSAGAEALVPDIVLLERDLAREREALDSLVLALFQFTPEIAFEPDHGLVLDVGPSLRLFDGPLALCRRIQRSVTAMGFSGEIGLAPTAAGAWLLARAPRVRGRLLRRRCLSQETLDRILSPLPCALMPSAQPVAQWLSEIGARDFAALRRLPRAGLLRRTSTQLVRDLDLAYGTLQELHTWIKVPEVFSAQVELFGRVEQTDQLFAGVIGLVLQLTGWLCARHLAVISFVLSLVHERGRSAIEPTGVEIRLAEPAWSEKHLLLLLKERLDKVTLGAPVIGLRLDAQQLAPMEPPSESLFPDPGGSPADLARLLELLESRLGADNVLVPAPADDHRPEVFNTWIPATSKARRLARVEQGHPVRPFWLLPKPIPLLLRGERPFYGSPLKMLRGPERIEAGWWDSTVVRDYFVAQGTDMTCYWVYLERTENARWFLHGLFG